mgnify:CR=1 FL=1
MPEKRRKKTFDVVKEVKRRARMHVGAPPAVRVADAGEKRKRQAARPKHRSGVQQLIDSDTA